MNSPGHHNTPNIVFTKRDQPRPPSDPVASSPFVIVSRSLLPVPSSSSTLLHPSSAMDEQLWERCVTQLMDEGQCADCAVVRLRSGAVLAAAEGGSFGHLSRRELHHLLAADRRRLRTRGLSLGGVPLLLLRDELLGSEDDNGDNGHGGAGLRSMDLRTKQRPSQGVAVCRTHSHLLLLMGRCEVGSGMLNHRAHQMAACLRNAGA
ncbi:uncharacterized protein LOC121679824 [Alosa sapidissima]|uniref:uncharacterized protein LOC121679824 n=1 Tax=Alosa sapidissima TaxID=34773 RepID=UPI001C0A1E7C|nr:uncharacterized protein LOC121679824 [Alosa sapidissima]